jgi:hypothetical protein
MAKNERSGEDVDRRLTTWEGARCERLRRWAALPLKRILLGLEKCKRWLSGCLSQTSLQRPAAILP